MTTGSPDSNGHGHATSTPVFRPRPLPSHDAHEQIHRRGSSGSARTHLDKRSFSDLVLESFALLLQQFRTRRAQPIDVDQLDSRQIAARVTESVQASTLVIDAPPDDLPSRIRLLQDLHSDQPSRIERCIDEQVDRIVQDHVSTIINQCSNQAESAPYGIGKSLGRIEQYLSAITYPDPDPAAFPRFKSVVQAIETLERRSDLLPPNTRARVLPVLHKHAADTFDLALAARCLESCNQRLRSATDQLRSSLADLTDTIAQLRAAADEVRNLLQAARAHNYRLHAVSASANLLRLSGPDARELLAGLKARLGVGSSAELTNCLVEQLADHLNQLAQQRYPLISTPAGLTTLLARIAPRDIAETLHHLLRELLGDSHSVYAGIRAFGVESSVQELLQRASPLCRLRSRNRPIFGVETAQMTIVRLPEPVGADDPETHRRLLDLFAKETNVKCVAAPAAESDITVVRTIIGFPIAIESNQETLLEYYATADSVEHLPHLFGVVPECEAGAPLGALQKLFQELFGDFSDHCW